MLLGNQSHGLQGFFYILYSQRHLTVIVDVDAIQVCTRYAFNLANDQRRTIGQRQRPSI